MRTAVLWTFRGGMRRGRGLACLRAGKLRTALPPPRANSTPRAHAVAAPHPPPALLPARRTQGSSWGLNNVPSNFVMANLCLSVLSTVTHLRTFSQFRVVQLRERMGGVSVFATFMASNLTDLVWIFMTPAVFYAIYFFLVMPRSP